jgi:uncharacterized protein YecE (DUF72 family)
MGDFYNTVEQGLKDKLGVILFQFPPSLPFDSGLLDIILENLSERFRNALEFRHPSWWNEKVYSRLRSDKAIFTGISHPNLPKDVIVTSPTLYFRFHGTPRLYYSSYKNEFLKKIADGIANTSSVKEAYVFFNNTATSAAIENANWFEEYTKAL